MSVQDEVQLMDSDQAEIAAGTQKLPLSRLAHDLKPIAHKWNTFGVHLDVEASELDLIETNVNTKGGQVAYCFQMTLRELLERGNPTKDGLCRVLDRIGERQLARRLREDTKFEEPFKLSVLEDKLYDVRPRWHEFGVQLPIDADTLRSFETHSGDVVRCLNELLHVWWKQPGANVSAILEALRRRPVGEWKRAECLEKVYKNDGYIQDIDNDWPDLG